VQNTKYETGHTVFDPPHMIIFANVKPEFAKLTKDRWIVWCIDEKAELMRWTKKGDTPKIAARKINDKSDNDALDNKVQVPPGGPNPFGESVTDQEILEYMYNFEHDTSFVSAAELTRRRLLQWEAYENAVQMKWGAAGGGGAAKGLSCIHNLFGCDDCEALSIYREDFDPPAF